MTYAASGRSQTSEQLLNVSSLIMGHQDNTHKIPDIIEFTTSSEFLGRPNLYPRQGTLLKVMFLQSHLFTDYDLEVISEWERNYLATMNEDGEGSNGIVPGVLDRIKVNRLCPCGHDLAAHMGMDDSSCHVHGCECDRYTGRRWFRETISVIGRRGSKGHIGAIASAYVLWHYIQKGDTQSYYGVDRDKRLIGIVFAGKKDQAKANQWGDINNVVLGADCFSSYISRALGESISIMSNIDRGTDAGRRLRQVNSTSDVASFEIVPKESTTIAGRGPTSFLQIYDECAHVVRGVAKADASEVYESSVPALDQFGRDGFIYLPSSPWQKIGLFYDKYRQSLEVDEAGVAIYPEMLMVQLTSWDLYTDWEKAHTIPMKPEGATYPRLRGAIQSYDEQMRQLERANPDTFAVERRSQWAAVLDAYLNPDRISEIWQPWPEGAEALTMRERGDLRIDYRAHGDPSKSAAAFGFAIGHRTEPDERGLPHVVFDLITHWDPADFEGHEVDYDTIGNELQHYLDAFLPYEMTFDQFNSTGIIHRLQRHARAKRYPKEVSIYERPATATLNWQTYETFKTALGLGLVHAPFYHHANMELTFLQEKNGRVDHPTSGPVSTKDVADCMATVVYELIGDQVAGYMGESFDQIGLRGAVEGGFPLMGSTDPIHESLANFGRGRMLGMPRGDTRESQRRRR